MPVTGSCVTDPSRHIPPKWEALAEAEVPTFQGSIVSPQIFRETRRGRCVSDEHLLERVVESIHAASLGEARWPATASLIAEVTRTKGSALTFGEGDGPANAELFFLRLCHGPRRRTDLEQRYLRDYWMRDESIQRIASMPEGQLVPTGDLFTELEKRTSSAYNEAWCAAEMQNGLNVRLCGPGGSHIVWNVADSLAPDGWESDQVEIIERLLPHVRQFVHVRKALADAAALTSSLTGLLESSRPGVIQLDRNGRIVAANVQAGRLLGRDETLSDKGGALNARSRPEDDVLQQLLAGALPPPGVTASGGSMTIERPGARTRLVVQVTPVPRREPGFGSQQVAALVLVVDPESRPSIDAGIVADALALTRAESRLATMLAKGGSVRDIAARTGRSEGTIRWHLKRIFRKQGISRQADLVRRVLSLEGLPRSRPLEKR